MDIRTDQAVESIMRGIETNLLEGQHIVVGCPGDPLSKARDWFTRFDVHHLPVVKDMDDRTLVGIVSTVDLLQYLAKNPGADLDKTPIAEVMTREPDRIAPSSTIANAAEILADASFQSLPVVDANGHCVGIVTTRDIVKFLAAQLKQS